MKFATGWWGIQILAETEEDKKILSSLVGSLPEKTDSAYENGELTIMKPEDADEAFGFHEDDIEKATLVVEFTR